MNSSISNSRALFAGFFAAAALTFGMFVGASEWLLRAKVAPEDTLFKHVALFNSATAPYAAFGDSHVARGFDAAAPVFNFGYSSENIEQTAWKAERYLAQNPAPKVILLQADPHLFSSYRTGAGLAGYPEVFSREGGAGLLTLSAQFRPQLPALWRAFFLHGGRLRSEIEFTPQGTLLSPGDLSRWSVAQVDSFIRIRARLHVPVDGFEESADAAAYRLMVRRFLESGARLCLVAFPQAPVYRDRVIKQSPEAAAQFERALDFYRAFAADPRVRFFDHRMMFDDPALYRDPDHLNRTGAAKYGPVLQDVCFGDIEKPAETKTIAQVR